MAQAIAIRGAPIMLDKLEMFIAVAKEQHFGRAAESLGITQPSLSSGIKQLEEQLGVQLIFRGSRFGGLTPEGQNALTWARRIVGDARQLREEMRFSRHGLSGRLRIAVIPTALTWAAKLAANFTKMNPKVRFTILSRTSIEILSMLDALEIDAGISYLDNEPVGKVSTTPLYVEHYVMLCAGDSRFADRESIGWGELDGERLCLLTPDMQNRRIINRNFEAADVDHDALIETNSTIVLGALVAEGGWVSVLSEDVARFMADGLTLRAIPFTTTPGDHTVGLIAPFRDPYTPVLSALQKLAGDMSQLD